jgi:phosphohistidine phosphatase
MKIFLLRHAPASIGDPDPERPLSGSGQRMARRLAKFMQGNPFYRYTEIWSSPYRRARETAEHFMGTGKQTVSMELTDRLLPEASPENLLPDLVHRNEPVLLVGHNPQLSNLASILMGSGGTTCHQPFKKCALFVFKRDHFSPSGFTLAGYLPPASLGLKA